MALTRKQALKAALAAVATGTLSQEGEAQQTAPAGSPLTVDDLKAFEHVAGIEFTEEERTQALRAVNGRRQAFNALRQQVPDGLPDPHTLFTPLGGGSRPGSKVRAHASPTGKLNAGKLSDEQIAFLNIRELGALLRSGQITSTRLTRIYLERLKRYGDKLLCLVTLTEDLALEHATQADAEMQQGKVRGPLHGIPFGVKDLFATKGIPTQWGAAPYAGQVFDHDAMVVRRLEEAGAVLCAKLSLGSLAMGDVWDKGVTRNPWNPKEGSSGSSAGSACATSAGLVAFAIGTETQGSITSPSMQCRVTGLRPTYGRVSRYGAMELSYTMDKIGPICREAEDCALVFAAICGADPRDPSSVDRSFTWPPKVDFARLKIGYLLGHDEKNPEAKLDTEPILKFLKARGAHLRPLKLTPLPGPCSLILEVEGASAFDALTRSGHVNEVKNSAWPQIFRAGRYVPAVEYLQAQRLRRQAMVRCEEELGDLDLFVSYGIGEYTVPLVNQCGYPQVIIPQGTTLRGENTLPLSYSFTGRFYQEELILAVAKAFQQQGDFHRRHPDLSVLA